jgi:methylated-DNA-[protein]-cysteine S-methyltransferase
MSAVRHATRVHTRVTSPLGPLTLVREGGRLVGLYFEHHWYRPAESTFGERTDEGFGLVVAQLTEYFAGSRRIFDIPTLLVGSPMQAAVWRFVQDIPYGHTTTYGAVAREMGLSLSAQQIGKIIGQNPLCIVVPCHRIIAANGDLLGYAGGPRRKRALLDLERSVAGDDGQGGQSPLFPAVPSWNRDRSFRVSGPVIVPLA